MFSDVNEKHRTISKRQWFNYKKKTGYHCNLLQRNTEKIRIKKQHSVKEKLPGNKFQVTNSTSSTTDMILLRVNFESGTGNEIMIEINGQLGGVRREYFSNFAWVGYIRYVNNIVNCRPENYIVSTSGFYSLLQSRSSLI